jgi:hypothetical protein
MPHLLGPPPSSHRRPARWPWILVTLLLAAAAFWFLRGDAIREWLGVEASPDGDASGEVVRQAGAGLALGGHGSEEPDGEGAGDGTTVPGAAEADAAIADGAIADAADTGAAVPGTPTAGSANPVAGTAAGTPEATAPPGDADAAAAHGGVGDDAVGGGGSGGSGGSSGSSATPASLADDPVDGAPYYTLHVASFLDPDRATRLRGTLEVDFGRQVEIVPTEVHGQLWHRVYMGRFRSRDKARDVADSLKDSRIVPSTVITLRTP